MSSAMVVGLLPAVGLALSASLAPLPGRSHGARPRAAHATATVASESNTVTNDLASLPAALAAVARLKPDDWSGAVAGDFANPREIQGWKVSGLATSEPSFTRLFNHKT